MPSINARRVDSILKIKEVFDMSAREEIAHKSRSSQSSPTRRDNDSERVLDSAGRSCRELLQDWFQSILLALRTDFWRVCETFVVRLVLLLLLLLALLELLATHAKAVRVLLMTILP